jgi:hypothetical protein
VPQVRQTNQLEHNSLRLTGERVIGFGEASGFFPSFADKRLRPDNACGFDERTNHMAFAGSFRTFILANSSPGLTPGG